MDTNLNVASWRSYLSDYFDQQLPDLFEFRFLLDFDRRVSLSSTLKHHASAEAYPDHIDEYLQEKLKDKAIMGPFQEPPISLDFSPFMTIEKSKLRRSIIDLHWPKGTPVDDGVSKSTYLGTDFQLHYPSVDTIIHHLNPLGAGANIFRIDISCAFRHIRIDPGDIDLLGLTHKGKIFFDRSLPFGCCLGSFSFRNSVTPFLIP